MAAAEPAAMAAWSAARVARASAAPTRWAKPSRVKIAATAHARRHTERTGKGAARVAAAGSRSSRMYAPRCERPCAARTAADLGDSGEGARAGWLEVLLERDRRRYRDGNRQQGATQGHRYRQRRRTHRIKVTRDVAAFIALLIRLFMRIGGVHARCGSRRLQVLDRIRERGPAHTPQQRVEQQRDQRKGKDTAKASHGGGLYSVL